MKRGALTLFFTLAAGAAGLGHAPGAAAQAAKDAGKGDDLRAVYATPQDIAEGKRLADSSCARCHGANGVSTTKGVPHLAGQRPGYLYLELRAYQSHERGDKAMDGAVNFLSDDALVKVSAYYASLDPPSPDAAAAKAGSTKLDPVQAGKAVAAGCAGCHGDAGVSKTPGTPSLVGLDPKYLMAAMKAYKSGQRRHEMMKTMLSALTEAEMSNVSLYYALLKAARAPTPSPGDKAAGKAAAGAGCAGCHGDAGVSGNPATPSLAGQDAQYLVVALKAYKDGSRNDETMKGLAAGLDDAGMKGVAAFYASLEPRAPNIRKPMSLAEWAQRCDRCHGVNGNSIDARLPALAAQRTDYLEKVLHAYRKGERRNTTMAAMAASLTEAEVENLAAHYARQKARAVVYVMPQAK